MSDEYTGDWGNMPLMYVQWQDHYSVDKWVDSSDLESQFSQDFFCETIGFLAYEDKDKIVLSSTRASSGDVRLSMAILRSDIVDEYEIELK